jgi:hypothetical protein
MANFYRMPKDKTMEETQAEIDALTHTEFMLRLASWLGQIGCTGSSPYYIGGTVTPMGMYVRAFCTRLAQINGDAGLMAIYRQDFANHDAQKKRDAADVAAQTPEQPKIFWIDSESVQKAVDEVSTAHALLTTYPVSGCVPLRTLDAEELKVLETTEL